MSERTEPGNHGHARIPTGTGQPQQPHLSARAAATALGVNERTVRRWIEHGELVATKVRGTFRISPYEIERARHELLGDDVVDSSGHLRAHPGRPDGPGTTGHAAATDFRRRDQERTIADVPAITPTAMAQLEAIRDQWLSPLVDRIESLAREATAERARADSAERERDELRQRVAELEAEYHEHAAPAPQDAPGTMEPSDTPTAASLSGFRAWWRRLWGGA